VVEVYPDRLPVERLVLPGLLYGVFPPPPGEDRALHQLRGLVTYKALVCGAALFCFCLVGPTLIGLSLLLQLADLLLGLLVAAPVGLGLLSLLVSEGGVVTWVACKLAAIEVSHLGCHPVQKAPIVGGHYVSCT
jgi:hypothetical protein